MKPINKERGVSKKMLKAEFYVTKYISKFGKPPTYRNLASYLKVSSPNTAFHIVRRVRHLMKNQKSKI